MLFICIITISGDLYECTKLGSSFSQIFLSSYHDQICMWTMILYVVYKNSCECLYVEY